MLLTSFSHLALSEGKWIAPHIHKQDAAACPGFISL
jgi:hypothetical protein